MRWALGVVAAFLLAGSAASADEVDPRRGPPGCIPVATRTMEIGCYVVASTPIGDLADAAPFWHLDIYPTQSAADAARGPNGTVVASFGRVWLFTIATQ